MFTKLGERRDILLNAPTRRGPNDEVQVLLVSVRTLHRSVRSRRSRTSVSHVLHDALVGKETANSELVLKSKHDATFTVLLKSRAWTSLVDGEASIRA